MQQQPARPQRQMVEAVSLHIRSNVHAVYEDLPVLHLCERLGQRHGAGTAAFHFRAHEFDSGLDRVQNFVIMPSLAVLRKERIRIAVFLLFCHTQLIYRFAESSKRD